MPDLQQVLYRIRAQLDEQRMILLKTNNWYIHCGCLWVVLPIRLFGISLMS